MSHEFTARANPPCEKCGLGEADAGYEGVFGLFRRFNAELGCAVLLVTHDSRLATACDRTIEFVDGRVVHDGSRTEPNGDGARPLMRSSQGKTLAPESAEPDLAGDGPACDSGILDFMFRRRIRLWTLWLLPLIAARAFVPGGFMLSVESGGLALTFCPGVGQPASLADIPHEAGGHAHHGETHQEHSDGVAGEPPCPFALVDAGADISIPVIFTSLASSDVSLPIYVSNNSQSGPPRADRARGPPDIPADILV